VDRACSRSESDSCTRTKATHQSSRQKADADDVFFSIETAFSLLNLLKTIRGDNEIEAARIYCWARRGVLAI
jgi:hypothetical protein